MDNEAIREMEVFAFQLSEQFGQVKTFLYSTQVPVDEQMMTERTAAIDGLIDNLVLTIDHIEHMPDVFATPTTPS